MSKIIRPRDTWTKEDGQRFGIKMGEASVSIEHMLPLAFIDMDGSGHPNGSTAEAIVDEIEEMDFSQLLSVFGDYGATLFGDPEERVDRDEACWGLCKMGGIFVHATFATISNVGFNDDGSLSSYSIHEARRRIVHTWGSSIKRALVKVLNIQRRYIAEEVAKARKRQEGKYD